MRRKRHETVAVKTARERCDELGARLADLVEARQAERVELVRRLIRLEGPSEEERALMLALTVERQVVEYEGFARDEMAGMVARADQLEAEAEVLEGRAWQTGGVEAELAAARERARRARERIERLDDAIGAAVVAALPNAEVAELEARRERANQDENLALAEVADLEAGLTAAENTHAEAARLRAEAASIRREVRDLEAGLPAHLEIRRRVLGVEVRAAEKARLDRLVRSARVEKPSPTAADFINNPVSVRVDPAGKFVGVDLPLGMT